MIALASGKIWTKNNKKKKNGGHFRNTTAYSRR
jgi:hypothetical protein